MTLQQLKYVVEIVNSGSMREAAKRLFISQPSLSNAMKELENELGFALFLRTNRGITLSAGGAEFLGYARQVVEQTELLETRYFHTKPPRCHFSVSTQHYSFAVNAFVSLIGQYGYEEYEFTLRETRTFEILEDVRSLRSELGILYLSSFNEKVLRKLFLESNLVFHPLFRAEPHIFISTKNPLAGREFVTLADLQPYPCLSFEQGEHNSFYFSEEILSTVFRKKSIFVSDRATLFNLLIGLNGYTISTGIISAALNGTDIVAVPLRADEPIQVGWISHQNAALSRLGAIYLDELNKVVREYGLEAESSAP